MLFAESEQPATWIMVASGVVSALVTIALAVIGYLGSKDRMRLTTLESQMEACQEKHKECDEDRARTKVELASTTAELKARDDKDRADLQRQLDALKKQVNDK